MKKSPWKTYAAYILLTEAVGALAGFLTREGVKNYQSGPKPSLTPPAIVFPLVWTALYALMGVGAARVRLSEPSEARTRSLSLFTAQLAVNFFWSLFFFNLQAYGLSFFWLLLLWGLVLLMILSYRETDGTAAWLQVPYFLWITFAGVLNALTWAMNR